MSDHIGTGWAIPLDTDPQGSIAMASGLAKVEQSIKIILGTRIGERVMRPTFGCRIHELAFAPFTPEMLGLAERYVTEALTFWEPRIDMLETLAEPDARGDALAAPDGRPDLATLLITVRYRIKATHDERSLVYPFYQIPGEPRPGRGPGDPR